MGFLFFPPTDTKNSAGIVGCIEEVAHNAIAVYWNPLESSAKVSICPETWNSAIAHELDERRRLLLMYFVCGYRLQSMLPTRIAWTDGWMDWLSAMSGFDENLQLEGKGKECVQSGGI